MAEHSSALIGARLRGIRREKNLTLQALADSAGLSKGHLSRFERGEKTLSLASLLRISEALGTSVGALLQQQEVGTSVHVTTASQRDFRQSPKAPEGLRYAVLSGDKAHPGFQTLMLEVPAGGKLSEPAHHGGRESIFVIKGHVTLWVEATPVELRQGDYAEFEGTQSHVLEGHDEDSEVLLIIG